MAIRSFDHTGFVVADIPRAHEFYEGLFGARPLHIANLKTRAYTGWPIISFVQMGLRRFELCLAQHPLPSASPSSAIPRIGFAVPADLMPGLADRLDELGITAARAAALPEGLGVGECLRLQDPDGNVIDLAIWDGTAEGHPKFDDDAKSDGAVVPVTDLSHVALEVTDLDVAEKFYSGALGLRAVHQDAGELGHGRLVMRNDLGQLLILEAVAKLSPRSMFCGPDRSTAPAFGGATPYGGAHTALSVTTIDEYDEIEANLRGWQVASDGDVRAKERPAGEKSEYFYDPAGNRLQLIILAPPEAS
jgi:catechol 2,3-dioxygenase-like lactoylglutathione lyase family enzyme